MSLPTDDLLSLHPSIVEPLLFVTSSGRTTDCTAVFLLHNKLMSFRLIPSNSQGLPYKIMISYKMLRCVSPANPEVVSLSWLDILKLCSFFLGGRPPQTHACHNLAELQVFVAGDVTITSVEYDMYLVILINLMCWVPFPGCGTHCIAQNLYNVTIQKEKST